MTRHLKHKAAQAFIWDIIGIFAKHGIAFIVSVFLARLLEPTEFGLVAMAMAFISVSQIFADFGLASALIQNKDNTSLTYSSVFFLNVGVGVFLFVLFWIVAPKISDFYGNKELTILIRLLSISFILSSLNIVQQTIERKNIEFRKITIRVSIAQILSGALAIVLAFNGWGVYALVAQNLIVSLIGTILLWRVADWRPSFEFSFNEVKRLSGFSFYVFLGGVFAKLITQLDTLVVGKLFSANTLGLYTRAASLNSLVTTFSSVSISKISFSLLSQIQDDRERFLKAYYRMLELVAFSSFCLSGALLFSGADIIRILFGKNWEPAIFIFQILVLKSFTYPVYLLIISVFYAGGKAKESFWYGNVGRVLSLLTIPVAIWWGFNPFLYSVVIVALLTWLLTNWFVAVSFKMSFLKQCKVIFLYFSLFAAIGLGMHWIIKINDITFAFSGIVYGLTFAGVFVICNAILRTKGFTYSVEYIKPVWVKFITVFGW